MDSLDSPVDLISLTRSLVDIDSTTGREGDAGRWLAGYLRALGFAVTEQPVDPSRANVLATIPEAADPPAVVFSTHFDCVPPFFPSRLEGDRIYGRGSCDAKGILAAQVMAADLLRRSGETRVGMVFVVGEERGSDGACRANEAAVDSRFLRFLINGERKNYATIVNSRRSSFRLHLANARLSSSDQRAPNKYHDHHTCRLSE